MTIKKSKLLKFLALIVISFFLFTFGVSVGHYRWPPFTSLYEIKTIVSDNFKKESSSFGVAEVLSEAFTDPVNEQDLYHPAVISFEGVHSLNKTIFIEQEGFQSAYDNIDVVGAEQLLRPNGAPSVVRLTFNYLGKRHEAFAYGSLPSRCGGNSLATLIIPGSGINQSLAIFRDNKNNYQRGIRRVIEKLNGDSYVLIKPNEDYRAWHNGQGKKLNESYIYNWHLNRLGSYSVSYLVESLAFTKWMKSCSTRTILVGLSQGGAAVLLNAVQSSPTVAVIASGHSLLSEFINDADQNQLTGVPGYSELMDSSILRRCIAKTSTKWFFSWGRGETGIYRYDAYNSITANQLSDMKHVNSVIHKGDHEFPLTELWNYLSNVQELKPFIRSE